MKIPGGYYLKARKVQTSEIAHAPPHVREIWDWLLMQANHAGTPICDRGQCYRSYKDIQDGLSWYIGYRKMRYKKHHCERAMKWLKKATMVTTTKTTRGMLITILNYDRYQTPENYESYTKDDTKATMKLQRVATINKNDKNDKNVTLYEFYLKTIKPKNKSKKRALKNIGHHLNSYPYEELERSVKNYNSKCNGFEPKFRKDPANFFGIVEPSFIDYLDILQIKPEQQQPSIEDLYNDDGIPTI